MYCRLFIVFLFSAIALIPVDSVAGEIEDLTVALESKSVDARIQALDRLIEISKNRRLSFFTLRAVADNLRWNAHVTEKAEILLTQVAQTNRLSDQVMDAIERNFAWSVGSSVDARDSCVRIIAAASKKRKLSDASIRYV